jgi:hypothetical protein
MTNQIAIIVGALIIGISIVGASFIDRYEISAAQGGSGNSVAWRLDKRTGETQLCFLGPTADPFAKIATGKNLFDVKCAKSIEAQP